MELQPTPPTAPRPFCFVLMPFDASFDDTYKLGIKAACDEAGAYCERVDEQLFDERSILERIFNQIAKADFIIADMTGRNPNVFYEVGYAHALGKRTILLTKNSDDIPFDLRHTPHIVYEGSIISLKESLSRHVQWCIDNPAKDDGETKFEVELYINRKNIDDGKYVLDYQHGSETVYFLLTIQNVSSKVLSKDNFRVGALTPEGISVGFGKWIADQSEMPDGKQSHRIDLDLSLLPEEAAMIGITIDFQTGYAAPKDGENQTIAICIYTPMGKREYPVTIRWINEEEEEY